MQGSPYLDEVRAELERCNKCGFCMAACPTFKVTGLEWQVTRGRIALVQDAAEGKITWEEGLKDPVSTCLLCRACMDVCPPRIKIDLVMTRARAAHWDQAGMPWLLRFILHTMLPRPALYRLFARLAHWGERLGLRRLAARSGLLRRWPTLQAATERGPSLPGVTAGDLLPALLKRNPAQPRARVAYFTACTREVVFPRAAAAAVRVLQKNGVHVQLVPNCCCGLPAHSLGDLEGARRMARQNMAVLDGLDVDAVIVDEGSCAAHLYELPELFHGRPEEEQARRVGAKIADLSAFLWKLGPLPMGEVKARVTWHDPCHLRHYMKVWSPPRELLQMVPGVTFVEAAESDNCCGGAGSIMITQPHLSDQLLSYKMERFQATGADYIVTTSPSCVMQLSRGDMKVLYLSEFLEMAYR